LASLNTKFHRATLDPSGQLSTIPVPFFLNIGMDPAVWTVSMRCFLPSMHCSWLPTTTRSAGRFVLQPINTRQNDVYRVHQKYSRHMNWGFQLEFNVDRRTVQDAMLAVSLSPDLDILD